MFQLSLQARNVNKSEKIITTDRTALFISKLVKCQQERNNKDETIRDKGREENREQKSREEMKRKDKKEKKEQKKKRRKEN